MPVRKDPRTGSWYYRLYRGKSYFEGGFRSRKDAESAEAKKLTQVDSGGVNQTRSIQDQTLAEAGNLFFENHSKRNKRSWRNDRARIAVIGDFFKQRRMSAVTPEEIESFLNTVQDKYGIKDTTRNHYLALLKAIYNRMKKWRLYFGENPAFYVEMKKVPRARVRFLYPSEEKLLTPVVSRDPIVWPYYVAALHTGMRIGELVRMKVGDVSLSIRDIFVPNSKSSRSRHVPVSEELAAYLESRMSGRKPEDSVLPNVIRDYVSRRFRSLCHQAGIENFQFHDLRHSVAARLLNKGEPIYKVSKILGHSSVLVTEQHYGHLSLADLQDSIKQVDGIMSVAFAAICSRTLKKEGEMQVV